MKLFKYTIDIYKTETPESIRRSKLKNFRLNATKGLIDAELQLQLNLAHLKQAQLDKEEDKELSRLQDAVTFQEKSIKTYKSQLLVLDNQ